MTHKSVHKIGRRLKNRATSQNGFSLVELLVAIAILSIFMTAIYGLLTTQVRSYTTQAVAAGAQETVRMAVELIATDIRLAGLDPFGSAKAGFEQASATAFRVTSDRVNVEEGDTEANGEIDEKNSERIGYYFDGTDNTIKLDLYAGTGSHDTQTLVENVSGVNFQYFDEDGNPTDKLPLIRFVGLSLTVQEPAGLDGLLDRTYATRIRCRNMGL